MKHLIFKKTQFCLIALVIGTLLGGPLLAQTDRAHYSRVFQREKPYRVYLPAGYEGNLSKRYPVVYYFHGNKGDHRLPYEGVQTLIDRHQLILVCWNGRSADSDERPYNNGYHSNVNYPYQFHEYFIEFMNHIDSAYRTIADRNHRAVFGHSMGGFMAYYLAGKYPQKVGLVINSKGSPEFFVGQPGNHTLIQHRHLMKNLKGLVVRFQDGIIGEELHHLNAEVHQASLLTDGLLYNYQTYTSTHNLTSEQFWEGLNYAAANLSRIPPPPTDWYHADMYPSFTVWDYEIESTLKEPGYIELIGVNKAGFKIQTRKWLPDGISIPGVDITVRTAAQYKPNQPYTITDFSPLTGQSSKWTAQADAQGRLKIETDHQPHVIGISEKKSAASPAITQLRSRNGSRFLSPTGGSLNLRLWNRGGQPLDQLTVKITTLAKDVVIDNPVIQIKQLRAGENNWMTDSFKIHILKPPPADGVSPYINFQLEFRDAKGNSWHDEADILPFYNVPEFAEVGIDDGDSEIFGSGNGNNIAEPGELIMIYQESHRTRLYYDDPYIISERLYDELQPDKWGDGYALSSLVRISPDCPPGHVIRFLACYEVKEWKTIKRKVTWGQFAITVGETKK